MRLRFCLPALLGLALALSGAARAQVIGGGGSGLPQPVVVNDCLVGATTTTATWQSCSGVASTAFSSLTSSTNTVAAMLVGTGASLGVTGSGTIAATSAPFSGLTTGSNTAATMTLGSGGTLTFSGTGVVNANQLGGVGLLGGTLTNGDFCTYASSGTLLNCNTGSSGSGSVALTTSPVFTTPNLGTPSALTLTNATGLPTAGLLNNAVTLAKQATNTANTLQGFDGSGNAADVAVGSGLSLSGGTLTASGAGSGPGTWTGGGNSATGVNSTAAFGNGFLVTPNGASGGTANINLTTADNAQTANYQVAATDMANVVSLSGSHTLTFPAVSSTIFAAGMTTTVVNNGSGTWTLTNSTGLTYTGPTSLPPGTAVTFIATGSTLDYAGSFGVAASSNNWVDSITAAGPHLSQPGIGNLSGWGSNVEAAAATALSSAGGLTSTIASGTSALGTSAISSATCATVVTTSAPNTATTDVVLASFNGDPTGVTGYVPLTTGMLTIVAYPTSGNVNFKVCNNTSGSITPGAITLNWRVVR